MDINLVFSIVVTIIGMYIIFLVKRKTNKLSYATLTALVLGGIIGFIFKGEATFLELLGRGYMSFIRMIIVPLVIVSLIVSIIKFKNVASLRGVASKAIASLLITTGIGAAIGIAFAKLFNLGNGIIFNPPEDFVAREVPSLSKVILDFLPSNPLGAIIDNQIIPIVILSIFVGIALSIENKNNQSVVKPLKDLIFAIHAVVMRIVKIILQFIPYGVLGFIGAAVAKNGVKAMGSLVIIVIALYLACLVQMLFVYVPMLKFIARVSPIKFFKGIFPAQVVAFTSQSSYGTLPVTIKSLVDNLNVSESIASFVAPLGSTVGMNACGGIYPAMVAIIVANVFDIKLTFYSYALIIITAIVASIGIAGVPGSATMATTVVLTTLGLPIEGIAITMAVDSIIDMMRTATNVTGAATTAMLVDALEKRKAKVNQSGGI